MYAVWFILLRFSCIFYCFNNMFMLDYFIKDVYFDANNKTNTFIYKNDIFYSLSHILTSAIYPWFRSLLPQFYFRTLPDVTSALPQITFDLAGFSASPGSRHFIASPCSAGNPTMQHPFTLFFDSVIKTHFTIYV